MNDGVDLGRDEQCLVVAVLLYDQVELLDLAGPLEVLAVANRLATRDAQHSTPLFDVRTVGAKAGGMVMTRGGLAVQASDGYEDVAEADVVLVPGGVVGAAENDPHLLEWLAATAKSATIVCSVCTGVFLLARAGVIGGSDEVTTHWEDVPVLRRRYPELSVVPARRWIDLGRVVTSAGISAGIDMVLHLVERVAGRDLAERTATQMVYSWNEDLSDVPERHVSTPA